MKNGKKTALFLLICILFSSVGILITKQPAVFLSLRTGAAQAAVREAAAGWLSASGLVKLVSGQWRGSGMVIGCEDDALTIVSAKHLLMNGVQAQVFFPGAGESATGEVIGYSASYDLAYLRVPLRAAAGSGGTDETGTEGFGGADGTGTEGFGGADGTGATGSGGADETGAAGSGEADGAGAAGSGGADETGTEGFGGADWAGAAGYGSPDEAAYEELRAGDFVALAGLSESACLTYDTGSVQAKAVFVGDYNAYMLLVDCRALPGMSGGGAFDAQGRPVGMIVAGDDGGAVCMPMPAVLEEYRQLMAGREE